MKKFLVFLSAAVLLLSLAACGGENTSGQGGPSVENPTGQSAGQNQPSGSSAAEELTLLSDDFSSSFNNHCGTDQGFYYLTQSEKLADHFYGFRLMYVDYAAKQEVYLCPDSGCRHNSESCSAVFNLDEFGSDCLVFVHGGSLYVLNRDYDQDGVTSKSFSEGGSREPENTPAELYRMGLDGSSRQKIFTFPSNTTVEKTVFADGDNLWFITKELTFSKENNGVAYTSSSNRNFVKLNLASSKLEDSISLELSDKMQYRIIGGSGTKLVMSGIKYPDGMSEEDARRLGNDEWLDLYGRCHTICCTLDTGTKEVKEIFRASHEKKLTLSHAVKDGFLYVSDYDTNTIQKIDLSTGEKTTLSKEAFYISSIFNDSLCCFDTEGNGDHSLSFVDRQSGGVRRWTLTDKSLGWTLNILADAGDQVLVIYDYDATPSGDGSYEIKQNKFALISKSDLYSSRDHFEPIQMAGSGM